MLLKTHIYIVFTLLSIVAIAQENLVKNGGFEDFSHCPNDQNRMRVVPFWTVPFWGTPDFFSRCASQTNAKDEIIAGVPKNMWGEQQPHKGDSYIGIFATYEKNDLYGEYVQGNLKTPLVKGTEYYVEYWVSCADKFNRASNGFSAYFSRVFNRTNSAHDGEFHAHVVNSVDTIIQDKKNWVKFSGRYVAKGGERYIMVGNFLDRKKIRFSRKLNERIRDHSYATYYYLDDVLVTTYRDYSKENTAKKKIGIDKPYILKNVHFETDKHDLKTISFRALNDLVAYMEVNNKIHIEIMGHTDNIGVAKRNLEPSRDRAKEVQNYLITKGINKERLRYIGYGGAKPIASNELAQGRAKNRRVEIKVVL